MASKLPPTLTLCVDPGEDTGWSVWRGPLLVGAHTTKMWEFADLVYATLAGQPTILNDPMAFWIREGMEKHVELPIRTIVCEDWKLYPEKLRALAWDRCRTARLIGALTMAARLYNLKFVLQPAAIKESAEKAGAEEFFYTPLHENRHQNDSIRHGVYFNAFGEEGKPGMVPTEVGAV